MGEKGSGIWEKKLGWIAKKGGMALLNTHPDYMNFMGNSGFEQYSYKLYEDFLIYLKTAYGNQYWHVLPRELARFSHKDLGRDQECC